MTNKSAASKAYLPQSEPKQGRTVVLPYVIDDLAKRAQMGKDKYGTYLMTNNGRDALIDAYQEALDLVMYLRQAILEREKTKGDEGK